MKPFLRVTQYIVVKEMNQLQRITMHVVPRRTFISRFFRNIKGFRIYKKKIINTQSRLRAVGAWSLSHKPMTLWKNHVNIDFTSSTPKIY